MGEGTAFEFETNITIAKNLNAPVVMVVSGENKTTAEIVNTTQAMLRNFKRQDVQAVSYTHLDVYKRQELRMA